MSDLEIHVLPVSELVPYANNAKLHPHEQVDQIASSIEEFGNCDPIAVWHNAEGEPEIVEGHGRLMALKKLGIDEAPVIYLDHLSDVFSECYGYRWSRVTCYIAFAMSFMEAMVAQLVIISPFPAYYEGQAALVAVLGNTPRILIASMAAYVLGDLANDKVFAKFKAKHEGMEGFKARAFLSSVAGEFIDCLVFYPFALGGIVPSDQLVMVAATQIVAKLCYEVLILPLTEQVAKRVNAYEAD